MSSTMGRVRSRLRLAVVGAAVATVLTVATAGASAAAPMGVQGAGLSRLAKALRYRSGGGSAASFMIFSGLTGRRVAH
jgi:hypothetical protein